MLPEWKLVLYQTGQDPFRLSVVREVKSACSLWCKFCFCETESEVKASHFWPLYTAKSTGSLCTSSCRVYCITREILATSEVPWAIMKTQQCGSFVECLFPNLSGYHELKRTCSQLCCLLDHIEEPMEVGAGIYFRLASQIYCPLHSHHTHLYACQLCISTRMLSHFCLLVPGTRL